MIGTSRLTTCDTTTSGARKVGVDLIVVGRGGVPPSPAVARRPFFAVGQGLERIITGSMIPDVVPTFGSLNMIGGECDH